MSRSLIITSATMSSIVVLNLVNKPSPSPRIDRAAFAPYFLRVNKTPRVTYRSLCMGIARMAVADDGFIF